LTTADERMRITSAGNVGIGTSSPSFLLDVQKSSDGIVGYFRRVGATVNPALYITANETGNTVGFGTDYAGATSPAMTFTTGGAERMRLDSSGNLGLGVTPQTWSSGKAIQINTDGALYAFGQQTELATNVYFNSGYKYISNGLASRYSSTSGQHYFFIAPSGTAGNAI
jgi:hypothetical protein